MVQSAASCMVVTASDVGQVPTSMNEGILKEQMQESTLRIENMWDPPKANENQHSLRNSIKYLLSTIITSLSDEITSSLIYRLAKRVKKKKTMKLNRR
uniref:Uncharacterized protein n=1 Tax=Rhizophora mucronata TaxID=61149 RepID=A0A2P2J787_RHIMU